MCRFAPQGMLQSRLLGTMCKVLHKFLFLLQHQIHKTHLVDHTSSQVTADPHQVKAVASIPAV